MNGIDLMQTPYNEICEITASLGYPAFRAKQIYGWAMKGTPVDEMSNLPAELRKKLTDSGCFVFLPEIKRSSFRRSTGLSSTCSRSATVSSSRAS